MRKSFAVSVGALSNECIGWMVAGHGAKTIWMSRFEDVNGRVSISRAFADESIVTASQSCHCCYRAMKNLKTAKLMDIR